jgi:hypothetical protein
MSKRRYKEYLRDDTALIPRTTRWRNENYGEFEDERNNDYDNPSATSEDETVVEFNYPSSGEDDFNINETTPSDTNSVSNSDIDYDCGNQSDLNDESSDIFQQSSGESSSDDGDDEEEEIQDVANSIGGNQPIFEGANLTGNQSLLLLMSFILKHQLTDNAVNDFLTIMNMHLPNVVPESKYLFYKKFNFQSFVRHYFCGDCTFYFGPSDQCDADIQCSCLISKSIETAKENKWYFSYWPLESQLKLMLEDDAIADCLLNRVEKDNGGNITDAVDGDLYKQLKDIHGYGTSDISLLWNADGVPVFRLVVEFLFNILLPCLKQHELINISTMY